MKKIIPGTIFCAFLLLLVLAINSQANPASYQCLRQEAERTLESKHAYKHDFTVTCNNSGQPIYKVRAWTYRTWQGDRVVEEKRVTPGGKRYGTAFNRNQIQMCGNPCR